MAEVFGRDYSKIELLKRVGDISQIAGIRSIRLQDGPEDGVRAFQFRTGGGLEFDVLADRGFDISQASFHGRSLNWRSGSLDRHPAYYDDSGLGWLRSFQGGLLVTCGLSQVGGPNTDEGEDLGLHGRISNTAAQEVRVRQYWDGDRYVMEAGAKMRESRIFGENLLLERTITAALGSKSLRIRDRVTNESFKRLPHMMLYHFNIGFPIVDESARLYAPVIKTYPRDAEAEKQADQYASMLPPTPGFAERVYYHEMKADGEGYVTVALVNEKIEGGPFGVWIKYKQDTLPRFVQWKMNGEGAYVCGLEPSNCYVGGRASERAAGRLVFLDSFASVDYDLQVGVIDDQKWLDVAKKSAEVE